jgi:hypothetical protein
MIATYLKMIPQVAKYLEFNTIDECNYQFACNNFEFKELKTGDEIFESKNCYKNFTIIIKGKILVKSVRNAIGYNCLKSDNNIISGTLNEITKFAQERNHIEFEIEKQEYSEKIYFKGQYFSRKIPNNTGYNIYSAVALEESFVIYIDSKTFEILFRKSISKSEKERTNFIYKIIHTINELGPTRFDVFFKSLEVKVILY